MGKKPQIFAGVLCAAGVCAVVFTAPAQGTLPADSQPSLFSAPSGNGLSLPGIMPESRSDRLNSGRQIVAPHNVFGQDNSDASDSMTLRPAPPMNALHQMLQERKKNWAEMTPEEIFGLKTPDKSGNSKTANNNQSSITPLEKFLMNQRLAQTGSTNLVTPTVGWNFLDKRTGLPNSQRLDEMRNEPMDRSQIFGRWLNNAQDHLNNGNSGQNQDDAWSRVFVAPQPEQLTPQQMADNEAFRQLLQPTAMAEELRNTAAGKSFASALPVVDPNLEPLPAGYNPVGASFLPVESGVGRPTRLAPLPTITTSFQAPVATPTWEPQPAPWTIKTPQFYVNPVRKY